MYVHKQAKPRWSLLPAQKQREVIRLHESGMAIIDISRRVKLNFQTIEAIVEHGGPVVQFTRHKVKCPTCYHSHYGANFCMVCEIRSYTGE